MIFVNTEKTQPVVRGKDVPSERDMFWQSSKDIPYNRKSDFEKFVKKFVVDKPYWDRQRSRCINGFIVPSAVDFSVKGDTFVDGETMVVNPDGSRYIPHLDFTIPASGDLWIPGRMYMYLNFWKMPVEDKGAHSKGFDYPWFTDLSWENWMLRERARKEELDLFFGKTRQRGLSAEEACDSAWIWFMMNNVDIAIASGISVYNTNTFNMVKKGVKELCNTAFFRTIEYDNADVFSSKYAGISIYNRTANGNAEILNGLNQLYKAHLEEIAIEEEGLAKEMIKNIRPSISTAGGRRTGFIVMTGTSGKKDDKGKATVNNLKDMEDFMYSPEKNKLLSRENVFDKKIDGEEKKKIACFIPAWKFRIMDENGNSLKQESIENWEKELNLLSKQEQAAHKQVEPMETTDMFNIIPGGFFGDYISDKCNRARSIIITHRYKQEIERGFLDYINPRNPMAGVTWRPDKEEGDIFIIAGEHPRQREIIVPGRGKTYEPIENLYLQGTDSIDVTEAKTSSSKLCSLIFKQVDKTKSINSPEMGIMNNFVAGYIGRPTESQGGVDKAFENAAKLSIYYRVRNMIEYTKILIIKYYEDNGLEGFLAPLPELVIASNIDRSQVSNKYGMPSSLIGHMLTKLRDWLLVDGNIEGIPFEFMLKAFSEFRRDKHYNCDITMAAVSVMAQLEEYMFENQIQEAVNNQPQYQFRGFKTVGGKLQEIYS